jgi:hypothetical protein
MATTITISEIPVNTTYTLVGGATSGAGAGAKFNVQKTNGTYITTLDSTNAGLGYVAGDTITILGTNLGGTVTNNEIITVGTVGVGGKIATFGVIGTGRIGDGIVRTIINVTGTTGIDTYTFSDKASNFTVVNDLTNKAINLTSVLDTQVSFKLADHERIVFTDKATAFDITGNAGDVYALLKASFGGTVSKVYEGIGISLEDAGTTSLGIADAIVNSAPFKALATDNTNFVNLVYTNVMGAAPTIAQALPFINALAAGTSTQTQLLNAAAHITAFQQTIGLVGVAPATTGVLATSGIDYTPYVG